VYDAASLMPWDFATNPQGRRIGMSLIDHHQIAVQNPEALHWKTRQKVMRILPAIDQEIMYFQNGLQKLRNFSS
jgi:hypothetical protein